jgi:hypothetical protein
MIKKRYSVGYVLLIRPKCNFPCWKPVQDIPLLHITRDDKALLLEWYRHDRFAPQILI